MGRPFPLGSIGDGSGTNFSIFSSAADRAEISGSGLVPDDGDDLQRLLEIHMATQALDEVRYDPVNRPSWVGRPMSAVAELLGPT